MNQDEKLKRILLDELKNETGQEIRILPALKAKILSHITDCKHLTAICNDERFARLCSEHHVILKFLEMKKNQGISWRLEDNFTMEEFNQMCTYYSQFLNLTTPDILAESAEDLKDLIDKRLKYVKKVEDFILRLYTDATGDENNEGDQRKEFFSGIESVHEDCVLYHHQNPERFEFECVIDPDTDQYDFVDFKDNKLYDQDFFEEEDKRGHIRIWIISTVDGPPSRFNKTERIVFHISEPFAAYEDGIDKFYINDRERTIQEMTTTLILNIDQGIKNYMTYKQQTETELLEDMNNGNDEDNEYQDDEDDNEYQDDEDNEYQDDEDDNEYQDDEGNEYQDNYDDEVDDTILMPEKHLWAFAISAI